MTDQTKIRLAKITAEYWRENVTNLQIQEFATCFLAALDGRMSETGLPADELRSRLGLTRASNGLRQPIGIRDRRYP